MADSNQVLSFKKPPESIEATLIKNMDTFDFQLKIKAEQSDSETHPLSSNYDE